MTSSSIEDAPKGMSFLFNPNRLNVATSRAKSVCILIASPKLLEPECRTIDQMRWANGVCRFVEGSLDHGFFGLV
jgi:superfamily I DNA and/or RNA helicase